MEALQGNEIIIFSFLGVAEWAILGSFAALIFSRLYVRKSRELKTLKSQMPTQPVVAEADIASRLQAKIDESERYLNNCDKFQIPLIQARIAFLQSELMAEEEHDSEHYWDNISLRLLTIVPDQDQAKAENFQQEEDTSQQAAAQLLEVPDYLDDQLNISEANTSLDVQIDDINWLNDSDDDASNPDIRKIRNSLKKQYATLEALKTNIKNHALADQPDIHKLLEQTQVAHAHIRHAVDRLAEQLQKQDLSLEQLENELKSVQNNSQQNDLNQDQLQQSIKELQQQVQDRELVIEQLQQELEALRTHILRLQDELENAPSTSTLNGRVFEETDEPDRLTHQIESLTDLLVQKSEQLAALQSDLPLPDDAFDDEEAMQHAIAQQENNQMLLPELDDIVHPSDVSASYDLTPEQQAMIEQIEDIDLAVDDEDLADLDELEALEYLQSTDDPQDLKKVQQSSKSEETEEFDEFDELKQLLDSKADDPPLSNAG